MIRDQETERLELIKKRLLEILRTDDTQENPKERELEFTLNDTEEKEEIGIDRLMEDIEKSLQRIKKNNIVKEAHYQAIAKNTELEISELKKENHSVK